MLIESSKSQEEKKITKIFLENFNNKYKKININFNIIKLITT